MQPADAPATPADDISDRSSKSPISVAILAAVACVPIVVAAGFLTDRSGAGAASVPSDISVLALRGQFDVAAEKHPTTPARAGY